MSNEPRPIGPHRKQIATTAKGTESAAKVEELLNLAENEPEALLELEAGISKLRRIQQARDELATRTLDEIRRAMQIRDSRKADQA